MQISRYQRGMATMTLDCFFFTIFHGSLVFLTQGDSPLNVIDPVHEEVKWAGLWLAAHKYFEVDRRKGNELSWKYEDRVYHKHFPLPLLKRLHPRARAACDEGVIACVRDVSSLARDSHSLADLITDQPYLQTTEMSYPFDTDLELFQYRRTEVLINFMNGRPCLWELDKVKEKKWADLEVVDFRNDTPMYPYRCAEMQFCPDPCYGRKTEGSVRNLEKDKGNPCRHLKNPECKWDYEKNLDFESLQRNRFNISCRCKDETPGFAWNSRYELCVDIDECQDETIECKSGRECQNLPGSYECTCRRGHRFDQKLSKCVEHVPLPAHSYARSRKVKAKKQKTALMRMIEYTLGIRNSTKP